jgi:outer membrane immunogenic protein
LKYVVAFVTAVAAGGFVASAFAADMPVKAPPMMAPAYNWSGFYVGVNAGAAVDPAHVQTTTVYSATGYFASTSVPAIASAGDQTFHTPGFTGGIQAGYNWQINQTVLGLETDFNYMGLKGSTTNSALYPCCAPTSFTINQSVKTDWLFTLRPRLGWAANNWLFYVTGGLAATQIKADYLFTDTFATANESASINKTKAGWALGGGVEYGLAGPWSLKAEYLHVDFGSVSTTSTNLTTNVGATAWPTNVYTHGGGRF